MGLNEQNKGEDGFPATRWTAWVMPAQEGDADALSSLLSAYFPPLRLFLVRKWGLSEDEAEDVLQGFLADKVLEKRLLAVADRGRGKFRTFLLTALSHYAVDRFRRTRRFPANCSLDPGGVAARIADQPEAAFDVEWARQTVARAIAAMKAECLAKKRNDVWGVFHARVVAPILHGTPEMPYQELVVEFGLKSPSAAFNLLATGKRMFERCLRATIAAYSHEGAGVDEEISDLKRALSLFAAR